MKSALPKVMHRIAGRPMVEHVLAAAGVLAPERTIVVLAPGMAAVEKAVAPAGIAIQSPALGTGHAVLQAKDALAGFAGTVLILYGDTPLIRPETLQAMVEARESGVGVVVLGFRPVDPAQYGRLILGADGQLQRIVEWKEASEAERAVTLCNSGVMAIDGTHLFSLLGKIGNANAKGEYYLTDIVALARGEGLSAVVVEGAEEEMLGVNSRVELAGAEAILQARLRRKWMEAGATMIAPETVFFSYDTVLGRDIDI
jgi:bifunctional UDP-N-acetylglucosamine pyrophosphorylase/glucosamine-1-phosphate N-acetyltransferase